MSRHAANPAAVPRLSPKSFCVAIAERGTRESGSDMPSPIVVFASVRRAAIRSNFQAGNADGAVGREGFSHFVSRPLLGHGFGVYPAPCGAASFCFGYAALWVMVPP
jgi:hypothetical protein